MINTSICGFKKEFFCCNDSGTYRTESSRLSEIKEMKEMKNNPVEKDIFDQIVVSSNK